MLGRMFGRMFGRMLEYITSVFLLLAIAVAAIIYVGGMIMVVCLVLATTITAVLLNAFFVGAFALLQIVTAPVLVPLVAFMQWRMKRKRKKELICG